jgi:ABC-2 type transport system permease protein
MSGQLNIRPIIKKEIRQILGDERSLILLLFIPAFLLTMYGYALNFDVKHIPLAVYDEDRSPMSRDFLGNFYRTEYFDLKYNLRTAAEVDRIIDGGKARVGVIIPENFSRNVQANREASLQVIVDGTNASSANVALGYIQAIIQSYSAKVLVNLLKPLGSSGVAIPVEPQPRIWYNPELRSAKFLVPGLIGFILMVTLVVSTAFSVVKEKERGTMEQIILSPIRPVELIIGKTIPYVFISLFSAHVVLLLGYLLFGVVVKGNYLWLLLAMFLFLTGGLGLGLLISTIAHTQQLAFMMAIVLTFLPTFILSGFVFPIRNMPVLIQAVTYTIPARYFLVTLRSIILKGAGVRAFWEQLLFLLGYGILMIGAATLRMKRTKEWGNR